MPHGREQDVGGERRNQDESGKRPDDGVLAQAVHGPAAGDVGEDEGHRPPEPHAPVVEPVAADHTHGNGFRKRKDRAPDDGQIDDRQHDQRKAAHLAQGQEADERGPRQQHHQQRRAAPAIGEEARDGDREDAHDHGRGAEQTDLIGRHAHPIEPHRQIRHVHADDRRGRREDERDGGGLAHRLAGHQRCEHAVQRPDGLRPARTTLAATVRVMPPSRRPG